jgi:mono/diheme cytochrome c family protein
MAIPNKRMSRTKLAVFFVVAIVIAVAAFLYFASEQKPTFYIDPTDQQLVSRGETIYAQYCAACHGAKLEGQPDWRNRLPNGRLPAPPHDVSGHTWHHPDIILFDIVKHGLVPGKTAPPGHESDMPAYGNILSDEEIKAVLAYIKSTWPQEIQETQQEVSVRHHQRRQGKGE